MGVSFGLFLVFFWVAGTPLVSTRAQVPYLEDPNTGLKMFESAEICEYLTATYAKK